MSRKLNDFVAADNTNQKETLALLADNADEFNERRYDVLNELGLVNSKNIIEEKVKKAAVDSMGDILGEIDYVSDIKKAFNKGDDIDVNVIELSNLMEYCKESNIIFGKATLFTDTIPTEIINKLVSINFNRVSNFKTITPKSTIADFEKTFHTAPVIYIASAPKNFTNKGVVISNCELIESSYHKTIVLNNSTCDENLLMTPLLYKDKIFFLIIKIW